MKSISARQQRFVEEYLLDCNATEAAIRAGYNARTAQVQGSRLLSNVMVSGAVAKAQKARSERTGIKSDQVLRELARIGFANMLDYVKVGRDGLPYADFSALTHEQAAAIQFVHVESRPTVLSDEDKERRPTVSKVTFKLADKRAALVDLGKHLGLFKDKVEYDVADPLKKLYREVCGTAIRPKE